jgi:tetratricopeptide (TPR) repeat protein
LLAISIGSAAVWWWKAEGARRERDLAAQQERAQAEEQKLTEAIARVPLVNARANDCLRSGNWAAGLEMVDELLALVDAPELQETKAHLLVKAGKPHEAYELVLIQLQKQPDEAHLHFLAGVLASTVKGPKVALSHFGDACHLVPENKAYQVAWAKACLQAGMRDAAVATFNRLLADDPQCIPCWLDYASAFYSSGQSPEAINLLQQAVKRFPENSIYHFAMARILDRIGTETADSERLRTAASYYRRSLELQPKRNSVAAKRYYEITQTRVPPQHHPDSQKPL